MKSLSILVQGFVLAITLGLFLGLIALEVTSLGPRFAPVLLGVVPTMAVLLAVLIHWKAPRVRRKEGDRRESPNRRTSRRTVALFALAMAGMSLVVLAPSVIERSDRGSDAAVSLQHFLVIAVVNPEDQGVTRTLAELERARRSLEPAWPAGTNAPVRLAVYTNRWEYLRITEAPGWSDGGTRCLQDGPLIAIPSEVAEGIWTETAASATPRHEMVHALMCRSLGWESFYSIPRWFHEGIAQLYSAGGRTHLLDRILNRASVWIRRGELMTPAKFCTYEADGPSSEVGLFYATAWEFTRSLSSYHGRETLEAAAHAVRPDKRLDEGLTKFFGAPCEALYGAWVGSF